MKTTIYSEARQRLAELLDSAQTQDQLIKRRDGAEFSVKLKRPTKSSFAVKGIKANVAQKYILGAVR